MQFSAKKKKEKGASINTNSKVRMSHSAGKKKIFSVVFKNSLELWLWFNLRKLEAKFNGQLIESLNTQLDAQSPF